MTVSKRPLALKIITAVLVITTFTAIIPSAFAAKVSAFLNPVTYENQDYTEITISLSNGNVSKSYEYKVYSVK